ncbi:unnamed protein product [Dicrocoelium dendriticum]|nr:unnamed protein product [Dicrocoelium dendriticum]
MPHVNSSKSLLKARHTIWTRKSLERRTEVSRSLLRPYLICFSLWLSEDWDVDAHLIIFLRRAVLALHNDVDTGLNLLSICASCARQNTLLVVAVAYYYTTVGHNARAQGLLRLAKKNASDVNSVFLCKAEHVLCSGGDVRHLLGKFYYEPPFPDKSVSPGNLEYSNLGVSEAGFKVPAPPGPTEYAPRSTLHHGLNRLSEVSPISRISCPQAHTTSEGSECYQFTNALLVPRRRSAPPEEMASLHTSLHPTKEFPPATQLADMSISRAAVEYSPGHLARPGHSGSEFSYTDHLVSPKSNELQSELLPCDVNHMADARYSPLTRQPLRSIQLDMLPEAQPPLALSKSSLYSYQDTKQSQNQPADKRLTMALCPLQEPQSHRIQRCSSITTPKPHWELPPSLNENLNRCVCINKNPYWLLDIIGRGGSSVVYSALDSNRNLWAIKDVLLDGASPDLLNSYLNEIVMLSSLKDSGRVIRLHDQ